MSPPPETIRTSHARVACDGSGPGVPAALGHPRVFLQIDEPAMSIAAIATAASC
jgi:NADH dehydrogenase (ubiquinone) Fe-S protein 6